MKNYSFEDELPHLIPHFVHLLLGTAAIVLSCEVLKKLHRIHKGLKEIHEGQKEIAEGRAEIMGRDKKK